MKIKEYIRGEHIPLGKFFMERKHLNLGELGAFGHEGVGVWPSRRKEEQVFWNRLSGQGEHKANCPC